MEFIIGIGKVSLYWTVLYLVYWSWFRKQTLFQWNRLFLIGALVVSLGIPFLKLPEAAPVITAAYTAGDLEGLVISARQEAGSDFPWMKLLGAAYLGGMLFFCMRLIRKLWALRRMLQSGERLQSGKAYITLLPDNRIGSFSFFRWVAVSRHDYEQHFDPIIRHEMVHVRQWHSLDILLVEILQILFWFHPVLRLYKRSLQEIHEYLADQQVTDRDRYARFLVNYTLEYQELRVVNHFFQTSLLRRRITMLYRCPDSRWKAIRYLAILPLLSGMLLLTAAREKLLPERGFLEIGMVADTSSAPVTGDRTVSGKIVTETGQPVRGATVIVKGTHKGAQTDEAGRFSLTDVPDDAEIVVSYVGMKTVGQKVVPGTDFYEFSLKRTSNDLEEVVVVGFSIAERPTEKQPLFTAVEQQPEFPGGTSELYRFLAKHIRYPNEAAEHNISGKVFVQFVVNQSGAIRDVRVLKGLGYGIDEEAVRVVLSMPAWQPGLQNGSPVDVLFTLPLNFQLEDTRQGSLDSSGGRLLLESPEKGNELFSWREGKLGKKDPLFILDGEELETVGGSGALKEIDPKSIESIQVWKGEEATKRYGAKGIDGVVEITSKPK